MYSLYIFLLEVFDGGNILVKIFNNLFQKQAEYDKISYKICVIRSRYEKRALSMAGGVPGAMVFK